MAAKNPSRNSKASDTHVRYIDASNAVAGRLCSHIAKMLLKGEKVFVFNAKDAVISGNPSWIKKDFFHEAGKGDPYKGPFFPRESDMILKRMIRGMLPKKPRGFEAFKNLRVYKSVSQEFNGKKMEMLEKAKNTLECKYITLGIISHLLGSK